MIDQTFELLGSSQTFVGILLTILLLCIFHNDSNNFIDGILNQITEQIDKEISKINFRNNIHEINESAEYRRLISFLNSESTSGNVKRMQEGAQLLAEISERRSYLQFNYFEVQPDFNIYVKKISNSNISTWASLYSFIFCLVVFLFDEVLRLVPTQYLSLGLSWLSLFIGYSIILWSFFWLYFFYHNIFIINREICPGLTKKFDFHSCFRLIWLRILHIIGKQPEKRLEDQLEDQPEEQSDIDSHKCNWGLFFLRLGLIVLFEFLGLWLISKYVPAGNRYELGVAIALLPVVFMGVRKFLSKKTEHTSLIIIVHCTILLVISLVSCILFFNIGNFADLFPAYDHSFFILSVLGFALINGLFLPFILPYWAYRSLHRSIRKKVNQGQTISDEVVSSLNKRLSEFVKKIP